MSDTPTPAPPAPPAPTAAPVAPAAAPAAPQGPTVGTTIDADGLSFRTIDGEPVIPKSALDKRLSGYREKLDAQDAKLKELEAQAARVAELEAQLAQASASRERAVTFAKLSGAAPALGSERVQRVVLAEYERDLAALGEGQEAPTLEAWIEANKADPFLAPYLGQGSAPAAPHREAPAGLNNGTNNQPPPAANRRYDVDEIARVKARNRGRLPPEYAKGLREHLARTGVVTAAKG